MVESITLSSWDDIASLEIEWRGRYFRGQATADWPLQSSLHRVLQRYEVLNFATHFEYWMLRDFRREAPRYLTDRPAATEIVQWLSLMQHHGAPTRLLDFTNSFYVAAYFALIDATGDSAVWAIGEGLLREVSEHAFGSDLPKARDEWEDELTFRANRYLAENFRASKDAIEPKSAKTGIVPLQALNSHARLSAQQGLFLMPLDLGIDFLENLQGFQIKHSYPITKYVQKSGVRTGALAHLRAMNITAETLFPGLDGLARSLLQRQEIF